MDASLSTDSLGSARILSSDHWYTTLTARAHQLLPQLPQFEKVSRIASQMGVRPVQTPSPGQLSGILDKLVTYHRSLTDTELGTDSGNRGNGMGDGPPTYGGRVCWSLAVVSELYEPEPGSPATPVNIYRRRVANRCAFDLEELVRRECRRIFRNLDPEQQQAHTQEILQCCRVAGAHLEAFPLDGALYDQTPEAERVLEQLLHVPAQYFCCCALVLMALSLVTQRVIFGHTRAGRGYRFDPSLYTPYLPAHYTPMTIRYQPLRVWVEQRRTLFLNRMCPMVMHLRFHQLDGVPHVSVATDPFSVVMVNIRSHRFGPVRPAGSLAGLSTDTSHQYQHVIQRYDQ